MSKREWPDFGLEQEIVEQQRRRRSWLVRLWDKFVLWWIT